MYSLTLIPFAFFSFVLPILAAPVTTTTGSRGAILTDSGSGTWFTPGLGSCGMVNTGADPIVALSTNFGKQYCGQSITINYQGQSTTATVTDSCPSCGDGDVDMSPATFQQLAPLSVGRIEINWSLY